MTHFLRHVMASDGRWYKTHISADTRFNLPDGQWIIANVADYITPKKINTGKNIWIGSAIIDDGVIVGLQFKKG